MHNLIDDLLLYSHQSQRPQEIGTVDLNLIVQAVLEDLKIDIAEKKAVVRSEYLPSVNGNRIQPQQIIQDLLSNALKYSQGGIPPYIHLAAGNATENGKSFHVITVSDKASDLTSNMPKRYSTCSPACMEKTLTAEPESAFR